MGKEKDLSPTKVGQIAGMLQVGTMSQYKIAEILRVSRSSVKNIQKKLVSNTSLRSKRIRACGRPRVTTPRTDRKIRNICLRNRKLPLSLLSHEIQQAGINISQRTVQRRLAEEDLYARKPYPKPRLTQAMMKKRLNWAKKYKKFSLNDWERVYLYIYTCFIIKYFIILIFQVCFSDESMFQVLDEKSKFVRRKSDEKFLSECTAPTIKHPLSVMVWSVISMKGLGPLYIVDGTMNAVKYQTVLEEELLPTLESWTEEDKNLIFMHDGAPCHKAKVVQTFLNQNNVEVLDWPGNSPDMNPIENVWAVIKSELSRMRPTNKKQVVEYLKDIWNNNLKIPEVIQHCIQSMPRRIKAVLDAKGGPTKY